MTFGSPSLLLGLIAVPLAALGYWLLERRRSRRSGAWSRQALLANMVRRPAGPLRHLPALLFLLGLTFLLLGFARPQRLLAASAGGSPTVVLLFDVSGSMAAHDVAPTRLRAAREVAVRFLDELPESYRVAVVTFADRVQIVEPPTLDRDVVLARLPTRVTPLGASAIGDGVRRSVAVIVAAAGQSERGTLVRPGATLLLSDGSQTGGGTSLSAAAVTALVNYIPIHTVAVGTRLGIVRQPVTIAGSRTSTQIPVPVQPTTLRRLSAQTDGTFLDAASLSESSAPLRSVSRGLRSYAAEGEATRELSALTAAIALLLVLGGIGVSGLWFGRVA